ncbi:MAG TPA: class I SAM-dependent methyltransferase [Candidatus Krumholzibacteria bacterium]|nr:class I SAM-dependent methyltransferase [Candidatus Krumholzibacteria bacterium]
MTRSPWLGIPLSDYEAHMALPEVAQAKLLANVLESLLRTHRPRSLAIIGCAGGNGFDRVDPAVTRRVVGIDLNADYIAAARERYGARTRGLELVACDVENDELEIEPVDFVYAALVLEYVDVRRVLKRLHALLIPGGMLATVVQLPGSVPVTPSPFASLETLTPVMHLVDPVVLEETARASGYRGIERRREQSGGGKQFEVQVFLAEVAS